MSGGNEYRVGAKGQVFEAAPASAERLPTQKAAPGSSPRDWETRQPGECAAIVASGSGDDGHPRHFACCLPVSDKDRRFPYCRTHWPFKPSTVSTKDYVRGLRRYIT